MEYDEENPELLYLEELGGEEDEEEEYEEPLKLTWPMILDRPRELPEPVDLTQEHLKEIADKLGLIKLAWPEIKEIEFESRVHFPESYLKNSDKEKVLLLYAENFRRQFSHRFPKRRPLFLATYNECGLQKMVCTSVRPTTVPFCELENWTGCLKFFGSFFKYEPLEEPINIPNRLYSPHTIFLRQSGQSQELATALCSLLLGAGYDAYVVFGYATRDTTLRILIRVDPPYPEEKDDGEAPDDEQLPTVKSTYELRSKFSLMMEQREIDKKLAEEAKLIEMEQERIREEEKPPPDEFEGRRYHSWILLKSGQRDVDDDVFIEPSTGFVHQLSSTSYIGIESVWNHLNYWVNMQDCSSGLDQIEYDFKNIQNWEHLLAGEPIEFRENKTDKAVIDMTEEEVEFQKIMEEKHLDVPFSWSLKISISHEALALRYPDGAIRTQYKRTIVEEFAPFTQPDGLVRHIERYSDFDCTNIVKSESTYENRGDKRTKLIHDFITGRVHEYFERGREDLVSDHIYYSNECETQTIRFYNEARYDGLSKIEFEPEMMTEEYVNRPDRLYYRQVKYAKKTPPPEGYLESSRRTILGIIEKYSRDANIAADADVAIREFNQVAREIKIQYHYGDGRVTPSWRTFIKPESLEMSREFKWEPKLSYGYQSDIHKKPLRQLQLYYLFMDLLEEEKKSIEQVRQVEDLVTDFLNLRDLENANLQLVVPLFNKEQNLNKKMAMLEEEQKEMELRELEMGDFINYLAPYLEDYEDRSNLTYKQANDIRNQCLTDFKNLLLDRALDMHRQFEHWMEEFSQKEKWYSTHQETITENQENDYFNEISRIHFLLQVLEIRMTRYKELSYERYEALMNYLDNHPSLQILNATD